MNEQDKKTCNTFCVLSAVFGGIALLSFLMDLFWGTSFWSFIGKYSETIHSFLDFVTACVGIAGFVLMIIARVKFPKSNFAKVLMWIYIVVIIALIILFIIAMIAFVMLCNTFVDCCQGLKGLS